MGKWEKVIAASVGLALCCVLGCLGSQKRNDDFLWSVRAYNEGVRWQRYPVAASHVVAAERAAFLRERDGVGEDLRISDWDISGVFYARDRSSARVEVKYSWHLDSEGLVKKTTALQKWRLRGKRWYMLSEVFVRGEDMPGLASAEDSTIKPDPKSKAGTDIDATKPETPDSESQSPRGESTASQNAASLPHQSSRP